MKHIQDRRERPLSDTRHYWGVMSYYERFEHVVALMLGAVISVVIVIALWTLIQEIFMLMSKGVFEPLDHRVFQMVFGMIMTLLIAMEFKHSILEVMQRRAHIIQVKTVILIALLALARKFIVLDGATADAATVAALGFALLVLGLVYWLLQEREDCAAERRTLRSTWRTEKATPEAAADGQGTRE